MGNINCNQISDDHSSEIIETHPNRKIRSSSPIKIEQLSGQGLSPLVTTVRGHINLADILFEESRQKRRKTEKQMGEFIDGLIQKGNQSKKYLDQIRKQKLVMQTRRQPIKKYSFNLKKFLRNQQDFLTKRNTSLQRSRQQLHASRSKEQTHHPKINDNSRRIAIQVSGRKVINKKKVILKNPAMNLSKQKWLNHDSPIFQSSNKQKQNQFSPKKVTEYYLSNRLKKQFDNCCQSLGIQDKINYLQFTHILQMMNFANNDLKQRAMLLEGWNLLAGSRITICQQLVFSFILSLFGIQTSQKDLYKSNCQSVNNDSPTKIKQDLDITFLTLDNEKETVLHQDKLDEGLIEFIQQQYKSLVFNKMSESRNNSNSSRNQKCRTQGQQNIKISRNKNNEYAFNYREKIITKAENMNILKPLIANRDMSGYQVGVLSKRIRDRNVQLHQLQNEVELKRSCTFKPSLSINKSKSRDFNAFHNLSSKKPIRIEDKNLSQQSTLIKKKQNSDPILQIQVNLGTCVQKIVIFEGDDINKIADGFLERNNIPTVFKQKLISNIEQGLQTI